VRGAVVLIRNPMMALSSLFDELRAAERHLPARFHRRRGDDYGHGADDSSSSVAVDVDAASAGLTTTTTTTIAEWTSWRDRMFDAQIEQYAEFIKYWTTRYDGPDRLVLSYEGLIDADGDGSGVEGAMKLAIFLKGGVGGNLVPVISDPRDVECVWRRMFVDSGGGGDGGGDGRRRRLDGYIIPHPFSVETYSTSDRPYTIDQLGKMADVLLRVSKDLDSSSRDLSGTLARYRAEINDVMKRQTEESAVGIARSDASSRLGEEEEEEEETRVEGGKENDGMGGSFHVFHVHPPGRESPIVTNWLMGLFDQGEDCATLITSPGIVVYQNEARVPITTTIVTRTNEMNLVGLYKIFKPGFDEVFFVLSRSGIIEADRQIDERVCEYDNVLCIYEEQQFRNKDELRGMVHSLTESFRLRFYPKFIASLKRPIRLDEEGAVWRLLQMNNAVKDMQDKPFEIVHPKFCIRGGLDMEAQVEGRKNNVQREVGAKYDTVIDQMARPKRLFYCGSTGSGANINFSVLGIYLVNAFLPEIVGTPPTNQENDPNAAIRLTPNSLIEATPNDFLVHHMHQHCEVDVLLFPGKQLHINVSQSISRSFRIFAFE
jgi:hypothetical protein